MAAMASSKRSTLNPKAPIFVPGVYRIVEDFSPQFWDFVQSCFEFGDDVAEDELFPDGLLRDDDNVLKGVKTDVKALLKDVIVPKSPKPKPVSPRSMGRIPKYQMRPAYCVSPKCTPRRINQPR